MKAVRHGDNLIQLTRLIAFNCFLVREDDGFTAIDTGLPASAKGIQRVAQDNRLPIKRVIVTHAHGDHVGSLDALTRALPGIEVLMTARDARFLVGDFSLDPDEPRSDLRGSFPLCSTRPTREIAAGDRIGSLEVLSSPGHTPGHVSLFDVRDGTLIAGDAFQTRGGVAVSGTVRPLFPLPALATWHRPTALKSALALRSLRPSRLAAGHGPVLEDPLAQMDSALSLAQRELLSH
ncbi:MAG: MBL fold metallo-hydrolase [Chloroflexota bacterium]